MEQPPKGPGSVPRHRAASRGTGQCPKGTGSVPGYRAVPQGTGQWSLSHRAVVSEHRALSRGTGQPPGESNRAPPGPRPAAPPGLRASFATATFITAGPHRTRRRDRRYQRPQSQAGHGGLGPTRSRHPQPSACAVTEPPRAEPRRGRAPGLVPLRRRGRAGAGAAPAVATATAPLPGKPGPPRAADQWQRRAPSGHQSAPEGGGTKRRGGTGRRTGQKGSARLVRGGGAPGAVPGPPGTPRTPGRCRPVRSVASHDTLTVSDGCHTAARGIPRCPRVSRSVLGHPSASPIVPKCPAQSLGIP